MAHVNPIRSVGFETANDLGGGGSLGGGFGYNPFPPYDLKNCYINLYHILHVHFTRCFTPVLVRFFKKNSRFSPFYCNFKIKSSKSRCKCNIQTFRVKMTSVAKKYVIANVFYIIQGLLEYFTAQLPNCTLQSTKVAWNRSIFEKMLNFWNLS